MVSMHKQRQIDREKYNKKMMKTQEKEVNDEENGSDEEQSEE